MERRGTSHSAPYGQACMSCFKAKTRCILRSEGNQGCERCHRLKKQCIPSSTIRRRAVDKKQDSDGRIARLEGLVSQLQSGRTVVDANLNGDSTASPPEVTSAERPAPPARPTLTINTIINTTLEPSTSLAAAHLEIFRSRMLPHFPFIYLPAHITVDQLQRDRPLLFRSIICVAAPSAREKRTRAVELRRVLTETASVQQQPDDGSERTMDLLLAVLTYTAWGWDYQLSRGNLSRLAMLSMSLVGEMRLDKPLPPELGTMKLFIPGFEDGDGPADSPATAQLFLERQRAVLGCYVLSSIVSTYFAQIDGLRWTAHMDESLVAISANKGCPSDAVLALQVRLQLLAAQALQIREQAHMTAATSTVQTEALLGQLQGLRDSSSTVIQQHPDILQAQIFYTELCILESIYPASSAGPATTTCTPPTSNASDLGSGGSHSSSDPSGPLTFLWQSLLATEACTSCLLTLPPSEFLGISFLQWAQLSHCIVALHYLDTLQDPSWNPAAVRRVVDLPVLLDLVAEKLARAAALAGEHPDGPDSAFTQLAAGMRSFGSSMQRGSTTGGNGGESTESVSDDNVAGGDGAPLAPQKGYFRNPRFWLDQFFIGPEM